MLLKAFLDFKFIYHQEIIPGRIQALKLNICDHDLLFINVYGPNNDDASFYETLYELLGQKRKKKRIPYRR